MKTYELYDSHYKMKILICVGGTKKKAYDALYDHLEVDEPYDKCDNGYLAAFLSYKADGIALWFKDKKTVLHMPGAVAHECLHATHHVLQIRGVEPATEENDEHYCYYLQWLIEQLYLAVYP